MFTSELIQKYTRIALYAFAGALMKGGIIPADSAWIEPSIGVVLFLVNLGWTAYGNRLNGLLAQVQAKDGVVATNIVVEADKISANEVNTATPSGVTARAAT